MDWQKVTKMPPLASLRVITMQWKRMTENSGWFECVNCSSSALLFNCKIALVRQMFSCKMVLVAHLQVCKESPLNNVQSYLVWELQTLMNAERVFGLMNFIYLIRNRRDKVYRSKGKLVIALLADLSQVKLCSCLRVPTVERRAAARSDCEFSDGCDWFCLVLQTINY